MTDAELKRLDRAQLVAHAASLGVDTGSDDQSAPGYLNMGEIRALVRGHAHNPPPPELEETMASYLGKNVVVHAANGDKYAGRVIAAPRAHTRVGARSREEKEDNPAFADAWCCRVEQPAVGNNATVDIWAWHAKDEAAAKPRPLSGAGGGALKTFFTVV